MYLSPFKYAFQAIMIALKTTFETYTPNYFHTNIWIMTGLGIAIRFAALLAMEIVSSPKRPKLKKIQKEINL
jgi:hypothetical protein